MLMRLQQYEIFGTAVIAVIVDVVNVKSIAALFPEKCHSHQYINISFVVASAFAFSI